MKSLPINRPICKEHGLNAQLPQLPALLCFFFSVLSHRLNISVSFLHTLSRFSYPRVHFPPSIPAAASGAQSHPFSKDTSPQPLSSPCPEPPSSLQSSLPSHLKSCFYTVVTKFQRHSLDRIIPGSKFQRFPTELSIWPILLRAVPRYAAPTCPHTLVFHYSCRCTYAPDHRSLHAPCIRDWFHGRATRAIP